MQSKPLRVGLSEKGFEAFLACHHRLATLTRAFQPYGTTLYVAVRIAAAQDTETIADELNRPRTVDLIGKTFHNVGTPICFSSLMEGVIERVDKSAIHWRRPRRGEIYAAALTLMKHADDAEVRRAYQRMQVDIEG